ncbi:MAG: hypothetical protein H7Y30_14375 [Pyrinomonadaceae bacterium]|nr:hypothetical protein [Pyrinomonadaceae bacterium]
MKIKYSLLLLSLICTGIALRSPVNVQAQSSTGQSRPAQPQTQPPKVLDEPSIPAGWKRYQFSYGSGDILSLIFPQAPKEEVERDKSEPNIETVTHMLSADTGSSFYFAGYIELLAKDARIKFTPEERKTLFDQFWGAIAQGLKEGLAESGMTAKLTSSPPRKVMISGREGQEQSFWIDRWPGHYRAVIGEHHIYVIATISLSEIADKETAPFMASFKLMPR